MKHFYDNVTGFLNYMNFYKEMVDFVPENGTIVEIGCFLGKSTVCMAVNIINSNKKINFYTMDLWDENLYSNAEKIWYNNSHEKRDRTEKDPYNIFIKNIEPVKDYIKYYKGFSQDLVNNFKDESIDFLFTDGDHSENGQRKELELYYPKIKKGGIIAGHDYNEPQIKKNVESFFEKENVNEVYCTPWTIWKVVKK